MNINSRLVELADAMPGVNRIKAVQQALDGRTNSTYLEIGVSRGAVFQRICADEKIAVDPAFKLSARSRSLADRNARATHYFETTSDEFFVSFRSLRSLRKPGPVPRPVPSRSPA